MPVKPQIAIGMPVYNGGQWVRSAIESLLSQTHQDFILAISDNASNDETGPICREYASADSRIRYVRQPSNIGAEANFRYVFELLDSEYFMWAAADDTRSADFLELNLSFLRRNPHYLGSTCPVRFVGQPRDEGSMGDAPLADDDPHQRIIDFFSGWHANGRFYSLFRRKPVADWLQLDIDFLGSDWTLITHLARIGKLNRLPTGWVELGKGGSSNTSDIFRRYRHESIAWILPFHRVTRDTWHLMADARWPQKARISARLARLNFHAFVFQFLVMMRRRRSKD